MGRCKDEMTPSVKKDPDNVNSIFGKMKKKLNKGAAAPEPVEEKAQKFVEHLEICVDRLDELVTEKAGELAAERGKEDYNSKALTRLKLIQYHLEQIVDVTAAYAQDN